MARIATLLQASDLKSLRCMQVINAKIEALPAVKTYRKTAPDLRSAIQAAFEPNRGDTLSALKSVRKADSQTFDSARADIDAAATKALGILDAAKFIDGEIDEITDRVPAEYTDALISIKSARDAVGGVPVAPSLSQELRNVARTAHDMIKHAEALHEKRWHAYMTGLNKQAARKFAAAAEMPGNPKAAIHKRAAKRYAAQAQIASVRHGHAVEKFRSLKNA